MVKPHTSDIRMTYEYIRVAYRRHTSRYEWHTNGVRVHTDDLQAYRSDIQMKYQWHESTYDWHTNDMQIANEWLRMTQEILNCIKHIELSDQIFKTGGKIIALGGWKWFLVTMLFRSPYFLPEYS